MKNYTLPGIRPSEAIGELPKEYTTIAQLSVEAALKTWREGKLTVTTIDGYSKNPVSEAAKTLSGTELIVLESSITTQMEKNVKKHPSLGNR